MKIIEKKLAINVVRNKLIIIYALNVLDIIFTKVLLKTGAFREINPLMKKAVESLVFSLLLKFLLPALLLLFIYKRMEKCNLHQLNKSLAIINVCFYGYLGLNILHIAYIGIYFLY